MKDTIFADAPNPADFSFNEEVSQAFDDMAERSIPFYHEILRMCAELCAEYHASAQAENSVIYDLGCSTGSFLLALSNAFGKKSFRYCGYDTSAEMLTLARKKALTTQIPQTHYTFENKDITTAPLHNAAIIAANFTMQFVRPLERQALIKRICDALPQSGIFLLSEKTLENNSEFSRIYMKLYYDFKRRNGYTDLEISRKREALENVLVPYRTTENLELLKQCGFSRYEIFFKWYNFTSYIAIK